MKSEQPRKHALRGCVEGVILTRVLARGSRVAMWSYYLYMGLLITTLVLWAIVAMRDDGHESGGDGESEANGPDSGNGAPS